jgi:hypothetical protein
MFSNRVGKKGEERVERASPVTYTILTSEAVSVRGIGIMHTVKPHYTPTRVVLPPTFSLQFRDKK